MTKKCQTPPMSLKFGMWTNFRMMKTIGCLIFKNWQNPINYARVMTKCQTPPIRLKFGMGTYFGSSRMNMTLILKNWQNLINYARSQPPQLHEIVCIHKVFYITIIWWRLRKFPRDQHWCPESEDWFDNFSTSPFILLLNAWLHKRAYQQY